MNITYTYTYRNNCGGNGKLMEIYIIDIWLSKLNYGWVKEIREALEKYNWLQNVTNWNYQTVGAKNTKG